MQGRRLHIWASATLCYARVAPELQDKCRLARHDAECYTILKNINTARPLTEGGLSGHGRLVKNYVP